MKKKKRVWTGYADDDRLLSKLFFWTKGKTKRTDELNYGDTVLSRGRLFPQDKKIRITVEEL